MTPTSGQHLFNVTVPSEWTLSFDVKFGPTVSSDWTNILHVRGASNQEYFPSVWQRPNRHKLQVRFGEVGSTYAEINSNPNKASGNVVSMEISLQRDRWNADILSFKMDGVLTGYPSPHTSDVLSACSSGGCPAHGSPGDAKQVYLCRPGTTCSDVEIRNLRFTPGPAASGG